MFLSKYFNNYKSAALLFTTMVCIAFVACKKEGRLEQYPLSISFYNGLNDGDTKLLTAFGEERPTLFNSVFNLSNGSAREYVTLKESLQLQFYKFPDTMQKDNPIISRTLQLKNQDIYSYLIYGSAMNVKEQLIKETIPGYSMYDSVSHFRFINLFENRTVDVLLTAPEVKTLATNLAYEDMTQFIKMKSNTDVAAFTIEFKDHVTGVLLATKTIVNKSNNNAFMSNVLFKSNSHILNGTWQSETMFHATVGQMQHF